MGRASSVLLRRVLIGGGTVIILLTSLLTGDTAHLPGAAGQALRLVAATALFSSAALSLSIHRSYPRKHDVPSDIAELYTDGPYALCRHPYYFFTIVVQASIPGVVLSLPGFLAFLTVLRLRSFWVSVGRFITASGVPPPASPFTLALTYT